MRPSDPFATRAGMISLVIHAAVIFAAIVGAVATLRPGAADSGVSSAFRCMDVSLVHLASATPAPAAMPAVEPVAATPPPKPPETVAAAAVTHAAHAAPQSDAPSVISASAQAVAAPSMPFSPSSETVFGGISSIGSNVVFVIDRSASMGLHGRLDRAREQLNQCLRRLPASAKFQVVPYHRLPEPLAIAGRRGLVPATPSNVEIAVDALERLIPEGGTDHGAAIRAALAMQPDVIYFLTDDDDLTLSQIQELTRVNRGRSCIHCLCFVPPVGESALPLLAQKNRGTFKVFR